MLQTTDLLQFYEAFMASFDGFFVRREPREHFRGYVRGLLAEVSRKNCWQLAEKMGRDGPQAFQRLLSKDEWDADEVGREVRQIVVDQLGIASLIGVIDESSMVKRGQHSVGVQRQYCGHVGKVENCQVGVYLSYVSEHEQGLLDRELYLPKDWCANRERRELAKVPPEIDFQTKPQLALRMLDRAWEEGLALDWVTADTTYGNSPEFRTHIHSQQRHYVAAIAKTTPLYRVTRPLRQTAEQIAFHIPKSQWEVWAAGWGEKGEIWYEWAAVRVVASNDEVGEQWLLIRRAPDGSGDTDFYLSNAPRQMPLLTLAQVASARHSIEEVLEDAKGEAGLDEYEVRYWHSWYRHMTLVIVALTWLMILRDPHRKKNAPPTLDALEPG